ncbi:MAG: signal peptidase II [Pseudomonadota bacterium]|nr:signal peptidase II [Pseudomonadota bacterium]
MPGKRCIFIGFLTAALVFALDQASKLLLLAAVTAANQHVIGLTPFFNLVMVWNTGVSFGMLAGPHQAWPLVALSAAITFILLMWLYKATSSLVAAALGAVMGGAIGNVADRLRFGAVADFFDFHMGIYHWPAFNVADSAICIGVVLLCWHSMFMESKRG